MPCKSDYLNPTGAELESQRVCGYICYLYGELGIVTSRWVIAASKHCYGNTDKLDEATQMLCSCIRSLTPEEVEKHIYNPHHRTARRLATWWEDHQVWDKERVKEEAYQREKSRIQKQALTKLTDEEKEALEITED